MTNSIYYAYAYLFGRPVFTKFNKFLYGLALRGLGIYNYQNNTISGEQWFLNKVLPSLGSDLVIFDVGANIGCYTNEIVRKNISAKKIYAFEPSKSTYQLLALNACHGSVETINLGLSDEKGVAILYDRAQNSAGCHASLSEAIFSEVHMVEANASQVELTTIDDFCNENKIDCIDLLKIDVEGYEINVLRGAQEMLSSGNIRLIQFEFTQLNSTVGVFFKHFYDLLSSRYNIFRLLPHGVERIKAYDPVYHEIFGYQNFICKLKQ